MKLKVLVCAVIIQFLNAAEQTPPSLSTMSLAEVRKQLGQDHTQAMQARQEARDKEAIVAFERQETENRTSLESAFFQEFEALRQASLQENQFILDHQAALNRFFTQDESHWENADVINVHDFYITHYKDSENNFLDWVQRHPNVGAFLLAQTQTYQTHQTLLEMSFFQFLILSQSIIKDASDLRSWKVNITLIQCLVGQNNIEKPAELGWIYSKLTFAPDKKNFFEDFYHCALNVEWQSNNENICLSALGTVEALDILEKNSFYMDAYFGEKSKKLAQQLCS
ncbi:MAG: hypothetical protein CNLJKLNK_00389 [Holosporales bacterium]